MKTFSRSNFLIYWGFSLALLFFSCEDEVEKIQSFTANSPVYMSLSEFRSDKTLTAPRELLQPGKICLYGDYLYINEMLKGIHIIDNRNPASPQNIGFLEIPGNVDIIVKDNLLFADSNRDLICFNVTDPAKPLKSSRSEDVFPNILPETGNNYPINYNELDDKKGIVIRWEVKKVTNKIGLQPPPMFYYDLSSDYLSSGTEGSSAKTTSLTGSMSRFSIQDDYLYAVNDFYLKVFSIADKKAVLMHQQSTVSIPETIFCHNQHLYIGGPTGMAIFSIENPAVPRHLSFISHIWGCDPVVVQNNYAYVTIRSDNFCGQNSNLLEVIDVSNPYSPTRKATFDMQAPYGLNINGNKLFLCDMGLKVFDATDPVTVGNKLLVHLNTINGYDVISYNNRLLVIGNKGLYQYDYSNISNIKQLSVIPINSNSR